MLYDICKYLRLYDMVAVCVLSHGDDGVIITADGQKVSYEDVEQGIGSGFGRILCWNWIRIQEKKRIQKVKEFTFLFSLLNG